MQRSKKCSSAMRPEPPLRERSLGRRISSILFTDVDASVTVWSLAALAAWIAIFLKWG